MWQENVQFYIDNNWSSLNKDDFQRMIEDELLVFHKSDKYGRPIVYMRLRFNFPSKREDREIMLYLLYIMQKVKEVTPQHIDNYMIIYDLKDCGWDNFSLSQVSGVMKKTGSQFPETIYRIYILNSNWYGLSLISF